MRSLPLKYVASIRAGQSPPSAEVHDLNGALPFLQGNAEFGDVHPSPRYECANPSKAAQSGDVLLSVRAPVGALNIADQSYGIGRGLCAITATQCDPRYLWWWFHTQRAHLNAVSSGSTYAAVTAEDVANLPFPTLPLEEQRRIADFLDTETARIDKLAALRVQMRELLTLKRERLIDRSLNLEHGKTHGKLTPLKYLASKISVGIVITPAKLYVEQGGVTALRGVNVKPRRISTDDLVRISTSAHALNRKSQLCAGDIVLVRTGQAGAAAVVPDSLDGTNCIDLLFIRPGPHLHSKYIEYVLNSEYARTHVAKYSVGSIQSHFNVGSLKQIPVPKIPREKQADAVERLEEQVGPLGDLDRKLVDQLDLLAERRQALITAATTGQLDVSSASRRTAST